jgi:CRP-like cAMP-binding protein
MDSAVLNDEIELLAALPFFADFERDALKLLAFSADTRILRTGDVLFRKNDLADAGFLMLSGTIMLDEKDDGSPSYNIFGRGCLLNQTALLAQIRRPATAIMREPGAVLKITRILMKRVLDTYPATAAKLRLRLTSQVEQIVDEVQLATHNVAQTVADF